MADNDGITLPCGHQAIDREVMRAYHGASVLWCPFCSLWQDVDIVERGKLFDAETVRDEEETGGRKKDA